MGSGSSQSRATDSPTLRVDGLRCEYGRNPVGIDARSPRLSWQLHAAERGIVQSAYQIRVWDDGGALWDSGKVPSDQSVLVTYAGARLRSGQRCTWQVRVWDGSESASAWSETASWEMGLLDASDWKARWIEPDWDEDPLVAHPAPYLRAAFDVTAGLASARLYATAHGVYELTLNGQRVGDTLLAPGYTSYHHRLEYQTYDVTALLRGGDNVIGAILGDGWWRGKVGGRQKRNLYGERLGLLAQLHLRYTDGREEIVISDARWQATTGPILLSDLQDGEVYDARLEMPGWDEPGYDASQWRSVRVVDHGVAHLAAPAGPPVRRKERFRPVAILTTPAGETVVDMGQNLSGQVQFRVAGPAGSTLTLRHGEALDQDGNFTMQNLAMAPEPLIRQEIRYTLRGSGEEVFTPHFTTMGFRYVQVEGWPGTPTVDDFQAIAVYSDLPATGDFTCSDDRINQLQHNIVWSQRSNFLEVPTDCPTRERSAWTGDAQVFARTGSFLMETAPFLSGWLLDLAAEQDASGRVGNIVPHAGSTLMDMLQGSAGWGDAATIIPWTLYEVYGDAAILEQQYDSMRRWVEYQRSRARGHLWATSLHFGEWLEPDVPGLMQLAATLSQEEIGRYMTHPHVATAYYAHSAELLSRAAGVLGKQAEEQEYASLAEAIKSAYVAAFVSAEGRITPDRQASYVRALAFDLLPQPLRPLAAQRLVELIEAADHHPTTGFLSTGMLCHVLSAHGHLDTAYALLMQDTQPSWLYEVARGATTIWENWNGIDAAGKPDGSLNHYSAGAVGSWLYQVVAGIDAAAPGYKRIRFQPQPGGGLTAAAARYRSPYGEITCGWKLDAGTFTLHVGVPANTSAIVILPALPGQPVRVDGATITDTGRVAGVHTLQQTGEGTLIEIGSGLYTFTIEKATRPSA